MNKLRFYLVALAALFVFSVRADEGMWLLQLMQQQHSIDMMKKQGLKLEAQDLYNPNGISLKDAVGIFGGGCTGEIISPEGLILTNHHCGYASIQQHRRRGCRINAEPAEGGGFTVYFTIPRR